MKTVNLKDIYPAIYTTDFFCQVSDSVAEFLQQDRRDNHAYNERRRVHKAYYSLSTIPESELILLVPSPETLYEQQAIREALYIAIRRLPDKQAARLYARYGLGISISGIARSEGVTNRKRFSGYRFTKYKKIFSICSLTNAPKICLYIGA